MANKYQIDDQRLCCMIEQSRWELKQFREERMRVTRAMAGSRYSWNANFKKVYVNLLSLWFKIVGRNLFAQNPRVMLSTFDKGQKATVSAAEMWMNQELVRQRFDLTMKRLVFDGLGGPMGTAKIALATPSDAAMKGWGVQAGQPLMSRIDWDDIVFPFGARDFDEVDFMGHFYMAPLDAVRDNPHFDKKARERLEATVPSQYNREGDERIDQIQRDGTFYYEELEPKVQLCEVYLPRHRIVKTFANHDIGGPNTSWEKNNRPMCLGEQPWIGHERGPYPILAYEHVPGNLVPKGPALDLIDLHEGANESYRKLMRQAARLKVNTVCRRDNPEDGENMRTANDGQTVPVGDPNSFKEVVQGGPHQGLSAWNREVISRFMEQAGNLATLGGLASQAGTLGQEELLNQQSNGQVASMQDITVSFVSDCCDRMLWYFWHDPRLVMEAMNTDPNLPDVHHVRRVYPGNHPDPKVLRRLGNKPDIKVDPYSIRHTTPQQRAKDLIGIVTSIYVPLAQAAQQQGIALDFNALLGLLGKYMDAPDLQTILSIQAPAQGQGGDSLPTAGGPTKPAQTERTYTRKSAGGNSQANQNMEINNKLSAAMAGAGGSGMNGQGKQNGSY